MRDFSEEVREEVEGMFAGCDKGGVAEGGGVEGCGQKDGVSRGALESWRAGLDEGKGKGAGTTSL